jgi:hypothetical protein
MRQESGNVGRYPIDVDVLIPTDSRDGESGISTQPLVEVYKGHYYPWRNSVFNSDDKDDNDNDDDGEKQMRKKMIERLRVMRTTDPSLFYPRESKDVWSGNDGYLRKRQQALGTDGMKHRAFTVHYRSYQDRLNRLRGIADGRNGSDGTRASVFSWWRFSAMNYDTYGYNALFGTVILFNVLAITALAIG